MEIRAASESYVSQTELTNEVNSQDQLSRL